jgi:hypothetical protein
MDGSTRNHDIDLDLVERINREHLIETRLAPADLLFVSEPPRVKEFVARPPILE